MPQHYQGRKQVSSNVRCIYFLISANHTKSKWCDSLFNSHHDILPKRPSISFCQNINSHFFLQLEGENPSRAPVVENIALVISVAHGSYSRIFLEHWQTITLKYSHVLDTISNKNTLMTSTPSVLKVYKRKLTTLL